MSEGDWIFFSLPSLLASFYSEEVDGVAPPGARQHNPPLIRVSAIAALIFFQL